MTITLMPPRREPFTKAEREMLTEAIMTGSCASYWPELEEVASSIAERLPDLLRRAGLRDTSENRRNLIDLVLVRWSAAQKQKRPSRSYRKLARR